MVKIEKYYCLNDPIPQDNMIFWILQLLLYYNFPHPDLNCHLGPESPQLLQYNFRLMDKFDQDLLNEYMAWLETREFLYGDVLGILNSSIATCKYIRQHACAGGSFGSFDVMDGSRPDLDANECLLAKYARYERVSDFFKEYTL